MIDDETQQPTLFDVIQAAIEDRLLDVCTAIPARIESYDPSKQKAAVTLLIRQAHIDETGVRVVETLPIVVEVPVALPQGGGYAATFPLTAGDTGVVWFSQASLDVWAQQGGIVDPLDDRRFDLTDAIFYPGVRDFKHALTSVPTDRSRFGKDGGLALEVTSSAVLVGGGNAATHQPTVMGTTYRTAEDVLLTALATYVTAIQAIADPANAATPVLVAAITAFQTAASTYLTTAAKVR